MTILLSTQDLTVPVMCSCAKGYVEMLTSIVTIDATLSMAQESVPSVVLAMLGCMVAMLECICMSAC